MIKKNIKPIKSQKNNKLLIFNVPELSTATIKKYVLYNSDLKTEHFKIKKIKQRNNSFRHELHPTHGCQINISKNDISKIEKSLQAKIRYEINKKYRKNTNNNFKKNTKQFSSLTVMTLNIRGIKSAKPELELLLLKKQPDVLVLQETFLNKKTHRCKIPGYTCIESKADLTKGGNGLLIAVRNKSGLTISEYKNNPAWMAGIINGTTVSGELFSSIIVNLHIPSSGIRKKKTVQEIYSYLKNLRFNNLFICGDFNMDTYKSAQFLKKSGIDFSLAHVTNSLGSRWNKNIMGRMIDHIYYSSNFTRPTQCTANKYIDISDHFPITAIWDIECMKSIKNKRKIDVNKIDSIKDKLINSNRFDLLDVDSADINKTTTQLIDIILTETDRLGAFKSAADQKKIFMSKKTIKKIKKKQKIFKLLTKSKIDLEAYIVAKNDAKMSKKSDSKIFYEHKLNKINEYLTNNEPQKMWNLIKYSTGKFKNSMSTGPVLDKNNQLVIDNDSKLKVWEDHFKNLAQDSTGNSKSTEKWEPMLDNDVNTFPECDDSIRWNDVTDALKNIPNNKAPGLDGIPNEIWKTVSAEVNPVSKMAINMFRILKTMWDSGDIPEIMTTSIVVPVPKKGNLQDPNNYRGISLIPTFVKILAKILANKLSLISDKYNLIAKEQSGFRTREECVSQATIFYEIIKRRKILGLETWIGFIDFSKAYDLVPHMALIFKLRNMGIGGKILNVICGLYEKPKLVVRIGTDTTSSSNYMCGVRQGCPASPILFNFFINDIFNGIKGTYVPSLGKHIPGLLFADDAVVIASNPESLQNSLDIVSNWADMWEMKINASKCGVLRIGSKQSYDFKAQDQTLEILQKYIYLGYAFNEDWTANTNIKKNKMKVRNAFFGGYSFLLRTDIPTAIKIKFINSVLMPIGCYGGETFGMSEYRCTPIQNEINKAIRLVARVGKNTAMERLRNELGIKSVFLKTSVARERAFYKWKTSKTWISDLIKNPHKSRMSTWVTGTSRWLKKFCSSNEMGQTENSLIFRKTNNNNSVIHRWAIDRGIKNTGSWIKLQAMYPKQRIGFHEIGKIRIGQFWTVQKMANAKLMDDKYKTCCPFCRNSVPETIEHLLLVCRKWHAVRLNTIEYFFIKNYNFNLNDNVTFPDPAQLEQVGKLLGGESKQSFSQLRAGMAYQIIELATAKFLDGIRATRSLILKGINESPAPLNQCPVGMELLERRSGVG